MENGKKTFFSRKLYSQMLKWKEESNGRTALLIEGARRVGKTTLVEEFAKKEYRTHVTINFFNAGKDILSLFDDLSNIDRLLRNLQSLTGVTFHERDTAIVFDEVQCFPRARGAIKALVENGKYDYIETGSLISLKKNVDSIVIPSEEDRLTLHPMDFEEFLWATGNDSYGFIKGFFEENAPIDNAVHRKFLVVFREYMAVGGMPQAVRLFVDGANYAKIDREKRRIIKLYLDDFKKIDPSGSIGRCFMNIPASLSSEAKRFNPPSPDRTNLEKKISEMEDSKTVAVCYRVSDPRVGLNLSIDEDTYKLFLEDTGLFITLCFYDKDVSDNTIYAELIRGRLPANLGYVYENIVSQSLIASGHIPKYNTFPKEDGKHNYEIDFVVADGDRIRPIEVKSSRTRQHVSLDAFLEKWGGNVSNAYVVSERNYSSDGKITYLPIYMVGLL